MVVSLFLQAALEAPDADAAIGNVTGSNSVNVFLGLGLPWVMGSLYYSFNRHVRTLRFFAVLYTGFRRFDWDAYRS